MGSIGRYIFGATFGAFLLILASLTGIIWITQALRDIDLMTHQSQTVLVFVGITSLIVPLLVFMVAPVALMIAVIYMLNKLGADSETVVMNSAGMSPWRLFQPFLAVSIVVAIVVGSLGVYFSPLGLRQLRNLIIQVRADLVSNIVQPGRFTRIGQALTFHVRERLPNGLLLGIFVDDQRDPREQATFLAEQGEILRSDRGTFLVLEKGNVQRLEAGRRDPAMVTFERYAFDLSQFGDIPTISYSTREKYFWELLSTGDDLAANSESRAEVHERITATIYPVAFAVIAFAFLGAPRTTRQGNAIPIVGVVLTALAVRVTGFVSVLLGAREPLFLLVPYLVFAAVFAVGLSVIARGVAIEPPAIFATALARVIARLTRQPATA